MASGKPIVSTVQMGYSIIDKYQCGIELESDDAKHLADAVISIHDMSHAETLKMGENGKKGALDFDFTVLTNKLLGVIGDVLDRKKEKFTSW
jgi:glycosyltransferase involved in cell wall biosynthesis